MRTPSLSLLLVASALLLPGCDATLVLGTDCPLLRGACPTPAPPRTTGLPLRSMPTEIQGPTHVRRKAEAYLNIGARLYVDNIRSEPDCQ